MIENFPVFKSFKTDDRPKKFGWAPGNYTCKCCECKCDFVGDKRAVMCADCAYSKEVEKTEKKKAKAKLKADMIRLHIANPKLNDTRLGKHFGISSATAAKYVKEYQQHTKPQQDFYNNLMLLATDIKAECLNTFYQLTMSCIKQQKYLLHPQAFVAILDISEPNVVKIFIHCIKHKIFVKRFRCECGKMVVGDNMQCPECNIGKFETLFEVVKRLQKADG